MSYLDFLIDAGKEGFRESYFKFVSTESALVAEGVSINATPDAYSDTEAMVTIDNTASINSGDNQWVIPVYIKMQCTVAGNGSEWALQYQLDNATRWASGGTTPPAKQTSYDTRSGYSDRTPKANIHVGDLTAIAASSSKILSRSNISGFGGAAQASGFALGDEIIIAFGADFGGGSAYQKHSAGIASDFAIQGSAYRQIVPMDPVWVGRGCSLIVQPLGISATVGPAFNFEVAVLELGKPREGA